jgi:integrase
MSTAREWVALLHADYLARGKNEATWKDEYLKIFNRLPLDQELTGEMLHALVLSSPVNTRSRVRHCMAIGVLARFAKLDYDPSPYRGNYNPRNVKPRDLPNDAKIVQCFLSLRNPAWRWAYGMIATYGLRPHEVFRMDHDLLRTGDVVVHVDHETKTGFRRVWPYHPEWVEQFQLKSVEIPPIKLDRPNRAIGESAAHYFKETARLPFTLYNLRHAWAVRSTLYGLPDAIAAQQMGHSLEVHNKIYQRWISRSAHQSAYDATLQNPNRPKPPSFPD